MKPIRVGKIATGTRTSNLNLANASSLDNLRDQKNVTQNFYNSMAVVQEYQKYKLDTDLIKQIEGGEQDNLELGEDAYLGGSLMTKKVRMQVKSECRKTRVHGAYA